MANASFSAVPIVALVVVAVILWRMPKVRTLCAMLVHATVATIAIRIDECLPIPIGFPRTPDEATRRPGWRLLSAIRRRLTSASDATLIRIERTTGAGLEPEKAALRSPLRVTGGGGGSLCCFMKSGNARSRGLPLWLSALGSFSGNREVAFYKHVRQLLSIDAPEALLAEERSLLARWCLVLTDMSPLGTIEFTRDVPARPAASAEPDAHGGPRRRAGRSPARRAADTDETGAAAGIPRSPSDTAFVVPDRTGCSLGQAHAVVTGLARLHATFWDRAHAEPALDFITHSRGGARCGYVPAPLVSLLLGRTLKQMPKLKLLWTALVAALRDAPVALLHGDCRPENLLFFPHATGNAAACSSWRVAFLDWEAVGVNPAANDLVYFTVVGLRSADSHAWQSELLAAYHGALTRERHASARHSSSAATDLQRPYSLSQLHDDFTLLGGILLVVQACFAVSDVFKGWGNNKRNLVPWMVRLCRFTLRVDVPRLSQLLADRRAATTTGGVVVDDDVGTVLRGMQQKAAEALEKLRAEHGDLDAL